MAQTKTPTKPSKASKTGRAAPKVSVSKTPKKRDSLTNKSILNFFQKVDRPEESMFVGSDMTAAVKKSTTEDDDIYGDDDKSVLEERYNEACVPSKRRKLSESEDAGTTTAVDLPKAASTCQEQSASAVPPRPKKPRKGPFLDDSDSELEDEETTPGRPAAGTTPKPEDTSPPAKKEKEVWPATTPTSNSFPTEEPTRTSLTPAAFPVCQSAPPSLKPEFSSKGDYTDLEGLDAELEDDMLESFEGEELREMRFLKEQARLEAEEAGIHDPDDGFETLMDDDGITESCPICNASLAGVTPDQATIHVNSCLDGNPTPLPAQVPPPKPVDEPLEPPKENKEDLVPAPEVSKRFARTAVARPGQVNPISIGGGGGTVEAGTSSSAFSKLMSGHAEDAAWATAAAAENASRGKPAYQRTCPFYKIMPGFHICVDAFRYGAVEGCRAYFLSHFHSDHYIGLTANWTHGPIYCSRVTGSLVKSQLKTAEKYVVELEFEEKVPVPGTDGVFVTMIPANHCPGSSLFLFEKTVSNPNAHVKSREKRMQRILHCGDFRACPAHVEHPQLRPDTVDALGKIKQQKIDVCYLDTTYLNPRYSFPPQNDVIKACADLCRELDTTLRAEDESMWNSVLRRREGRGAGTNDTVSRFFVAADKPGADVKTEETDVSSVPGLAGEAPVAPNALSILGQKARANRNRLLVVCGTYSIGKERICKAIALALGTKIFASPAKIRICRQLGDPELAALMTNDPHEAQVHMQMLMELRAETLADYLDHHRPHFGRVVGFRPSGWSYRPALANNGGTTSGGSIVPAAQVTANMPPSSVATTQILHGPAWRTSFGPHNLVPQQGSSREAMCFGAPYSEHSSFRELMLFVMSLRIEKVVPTVNVGSEPGRRRMKAWTDRWLAERRRGGCVRPLAQGGEELDGGNERQGAARVKIEDDQDEKGVDGKLKMKKRDAALWDGKDGRGGAVIW